MSKATTKSPAQVINGVKFPRRYSEELAKSALEYEPRADDVFVVTYPKCGTTWTSQMLILIFRDGVPLSSMEEQFTVCPYIDLMGIKGVKAMKRPGAIRTHLPYNRAPRSKEAKYIFVVRNPKDCCVSYYHHILKRGSTESFDEYFERFISGDVGFGNYFDHLLGWHEHRNDPNMLFLVFEEMKKNPEEAIIKMASFIDEEKYGKPLKEDPQKLKKVLDGSKFDFMKATFKEQLAGQDFIVPKEIHEIFADLQMREDKFKMEHTGNSNLVRKGAVGDWRNYFNEDQNKRMNDVIKDRIKDSHLLKLWEGCM